MYNKIFTTILDSSIWLEPDATRLVWLTLIAAMDEDGMCQFASVANLAHRARVTLEAAKEAVTALEGVDENSSDPDNEGRRIERVPGGWIVLNAKKYRELVTRTVIKEQTRARVARHRAKRASNALKRTSNAVVTQSDTDSDTSEEDKSSSCSEASPSELTILEFPVVRSDKPWRLTARKLAEYEGSYPHLDVLAHCREARQWAIDNPSKRKTPQGMPAFLTRWLGKAQNSGKGISKPIEPSLPDRTEELGPCNTDEVFAALKARMNAPKVSPLNSFKLQ